MGVLYSKIIVQIIVKALNWRFTLFSLMNVIFDETIYPVSPQLPPIGPIIFDVLSFDADYDSNNVDDDDDVAVDKNFKNFFRLCVCPALVCLSCLPFLW